jgi:hypothetical protein
MEISFIEVKQELHASLCIVSHFMDRFAWRQAPQLSPLFKFAVSRSSRVIFQCVAVIIRFLHTTLKKSVEKSLVILQHVLAHFTVPYLGSVILKPCS